MVVLCPVNLQRRISSDMAKALVSPETWQAIKMASLSGVPDIKLAEHFGVTPGSISARRFDDADWKASYKTLRSAIATQSQRKNAESKIELVLTENLQEIGERNAQLVASYTAQKLKETVSQDVLPAPSNWSEFSTANAMLRKITGQDKEAPSVSLNLFTGDAGSAFYSEAPTFETVVETQEGDFC